MNKTAKILLVNDEKDILEILSRRLIAENYEVVKAYNGVECLKILKGYRPDLILVDLNMPKMNGFETIRVIRQRIKWHIPIIVVTATDSDTESTRQCLDSGADGCICVPCEKEELLTKIREMTMK
ncbi:MAG: response regulator [Chlamydiae bacterium]|nr:response regulator [Chlamydiota bacterium]MBI3276859.1 response regulator [Chlamydiota bacterium]